MLFEDLRYALRTFRRAPGFAAAALISLGLGIGANTIVFSLVNAALLRPYPYEQPERLGVIANRETNGAEDLLPLSYPDILAIRESGVFVDVAVHDWEPFNLRIDRSTHWEGGGRVSAVTFNLLGVRALLGRVFLPGEDEPGTPPVVLLSEGLWRSRFGSDPAVVGRVIALDGQPHEVVGVVPAAADIPDGAKLWVPLRIDPETSTRRTHALQAFGRLADGVTWEQAQTRLHDLASRLASEYPETNENRDIAIVSLREARTGDTRPAFLALLAAVGVLLLMVCANLANLLLARATTRAREMSVRVALGASRLRIVRQLLTESFALAAGGCALGLALGMWGTPALLRLVPVELPSWLAAEVDVSVIGFTAILSGFAALIFGLAPALHSASAGAAASLNAGRGVVEAGGRRLRDALVLGEVALSVALLIAAGLLIRSFLGLSAVDPGFSTENRLVATLQLSPLRYADDADLTRFADRLVQQVGARPETRAVGYATRFPLRSGVNSVMWWHDGQDGEAYKDNEQAQLNSVSPAYFRAMGIELVAGRPFSRADDANGPDLLIINRTFAERYWPGENPIGRRISFQYPPRFREIVGVVGDVKNLGLGQPPRLQMYVPYAQRPTNRLSIVVHSAADPAGLAGELQQIVYGLDPDQALSEIRSLADISALSIWGWRLLTQLFWLFGGFALLLAGVGIYGVISYSVSRRVREIGTRIALGARAGDVVELVLSRVGRLVALGLVAGLALGLLATRWVEGMLYGVSFIDPLTYLGVIFLFGLIASTAALLPALRALRIDPVAALREDP